MTRGRLLLVAGLLLAGCATKGQIRMLEGEIRAMRVEEARRDSSRAAALAAVISLQQRIFDSLAAGREALRVLDVRLQADVTDLQRQLLAVQELTGQSQKRLSELKLNIDNRSEQLAASGIRPAADSAGAAAPGPVSAPTADQLFQGAMMQLRAGRLTTARGSFQEFLKTYPSHAQVPDALFQVGSTFQDGAAPDSAVVYYNQLLTRFPRAAKATTALLKLGSIEEARHNPAGAKAFYDRILREYPNSDDADIARDRLKNLRP